QSCGPGSTDHAVPSPPSALARITLMQVANSQRWTARRETLPRLAPGPSRLTPGARSRGRRVALLDDRCALADLGTGSSCDECEKLVPVGAVPCREVAEAEVLQRFHGEAGLLRATAEHVLLEEMHHGRESLLPIRRGNGARIEDARPAFAAVRSL